MTSRILPQFELVMPKSLAEAFDHLDTYGKNTAIMAGGTDLMTEMKKAPLADYVLSLAQIPELNILECDTQKGLRLGAMTTLADVVKSQEVRREYPALWFSAASNGTVQTRNMGTVLGNVLRGSPSGDCCCAILAYGGSVVLQSSSGEREVDIDEFWSGYRQTARKDNEIAVALRLPALKETTRSAFKDLTRTNMDLAKVNAAVCMVIEDKVCKNIRIAIGGVAPTTLRLKDCESFLQGNELSEDILHQVEQKVSETIQPIDDVRSTAEYRKYASGALVRQTIAAALT